MLTPSEDHIHQQGWLFPAPSNLSTSPQNETVFPEIVTWMGTKEDDEPSSPSSEFISTSPKQNIFLHANKEQPSNSPSQLSVHDLQEPEPRTPNYMMTHGSRDCLLLLCEICNQYCKADLTMPELRIRPGPGDTRYSFRCEKCNLGKQYFRHKEKQWLDIALTGLYNLQLSENRRFFHVKRELCTWVLKNWDQVCVGRTKTPTWWATLNAQITTRPDLFETESYGSGKWGLRISLFSSSSAPSSSTNAIQYPSEHSSHITRRNVISLVESVNPEEGLPSPHRSDENSQDPLSTDDELSEGEDDQSYNVASGHPPPPPPPPVEYSLPQILSKQTNSNDNGSKSQYYVQWENGERSWEDVETFASRYPHIVNQFEKKAASTAEHNTSHTTQTTPLSPSHPVTPPLPPPSKRRRHRRLKQFSSLWCHQCKQKHADVVYCSRFLKGTCSKKYCKGCLARHYNEHLSEEDKQTWICIYCRNSCTCASCRRKRGEETSSRSRASSGRKRRKGSSKLKITKRTRHLQSTLVNSSHIERILARIEKGDHVKYLVQLKECKSAPYVWIDRKDMNCPELLAAFDQGLKISVPAALLLQFNRKFVTAPHRRRKSYLTARTNKDFDLDRIVSYDSTSSRRIVLPKKQNIEVPGFVEIGYRTDEQIQQLLESLPPDESGDEDTSDECYLNRHTPYEKSEQEKWKEHLAMVQGTDGLRGSRATSSFMKKARIEGEAKVTLKDLLDAGILNVGEEFTFKGQGDSGKLLPSGEIEWHGQLFSSLSTFAKQVATSLNFGSPGTLYNGWAVVECRGQPMEHYRDLYRSKLQDITFYVQPQKAFTTDEHDSFEEDTQDDGEVLDDNDDEFVDTVANDYRRRRSKSGGSSGSGHSHTSRDLRRKRERSPQRKHLSSSPSSYEEGNFDFSKENTHRFQRYQSSDPKNSIHASDPLDSATLSRENYSDNENENENENEYEYDSSFIQDSDTENIATTTYASSLHFSNPSVSTRQTSSEFHSNSQFSTTETERATPSMISSTSTLVAPTTDQNMPETIDFESPSNFPVNGVGLSTSYLAPSSLCCNNSDWGVLGDEIDNINPPFSTEPSTHHGSLHAPLPTNVLSSYPE